MLPEEIHEQADIGEVAQHAGFHGGGGKFGPEGVELGEQLGGRAGGDGQDAAGVLGGEAGDGGGAVDAEGGIGFEVGLKAGAAATIRAGNGERHGHRPGPGFDFRHGGRLTEETTA